MSSRNGLSKTQVKGWLAQFEGRRVAVVGDVILDQFLWGDATRISPEAPVPVVLLERRTASLGGAANVAANIAALGGRPVLFAGRGADAAGDQLVALLEAGGVEIGALPAIPGRQTTTKHRVFARNKHILRFDHEDTAPYSATLTRELTQALARAEFDVAVVSDYAKGGVTQGLVAAVSKLCGQRRVPWCADPKSPAIRYRGATVLKPNRGELEILAGMRIRSEIELRQAAAKVLRRQGVQHLLVTRGAEGMTLFGPDGVIALLPSHAREVADVTGAGDTVSATLALGLAAGLKPAEAASLANLAAGHVVTVPGVSVVRPHDLLAQLAAQ